MPVTTNGSTKVVTRKVRLSYVHLFTPWTNDPKNTPKYSTVILIPKSDKQTLKAIEDARAVAEINGKAKFGASWGKKGLKNTLHDGDEEGDLDTNPEYAGHMYMTVSANTQPGVVGRDLNPVMDSTEVYSGCYARVSINAFPYNTQGNQGVSFGLNHVQKLADGDFLGGRSRAEDDFDALDDEDDEDEASSLM